jgi:hypothetical protein
MRKKRFKALVDDSNVKVSNKVTAGMGAIIVMEKLSKDKHKTTKKPYDGMVTNENDLTTAIKNKITYVTLNDGVITYC